jgi:hypothetical protein
MPNFYDQKQDPKHKLDVDEIDDLDELGEREQLCLVWCETHQEHEWHWLGRAE